MPLHRKITNSACNSLESSPRCSWQFWLGLVSMATLTALRARVCSELNLQGHVHNAAWLIRARNTKDSKHTWSWLSIWCLHICKFSHLITYHEPWFKRWCLVHKGCNTNLFPHTFCYILKCPELISFTREPVRHWYLLFQNTHHNGND
jgi:hypothetical protein